MNRQLLLFGASSLIGALAVGSVMSCVGWFFLNAQMPAPVAELPAKKEPPRPKVDPPVEAPKPKPQEEVEPNENLPFSEIKEVVVKQPTATAPGSPLDRLDRNELAPIHRDGLPAEVVAVIPRQASVPALTFTPDGQRLALARSDGIIEFWDLTGAKPREHANVQLDGKTDRANRIAISSDGLWMATIHGLPGKQVRLWKLTDDGARPIGSRDFKRVESLAFHPDSKTLLCGSNDAHLLNISDNGLEPRQYTLIGPHDCFTFNKAGSLFASVVFNPARNGPLYGSEIKFWNVSADRRFEEFRLIQQDRFIKAFALSPDGKNLATSALDLSVRIWDLTAVPPTASVLFSTSTWVKAMHFTPDGARLVVVANQNDIVLWNIHKGVQEKSWRLPSQNKTPGVHNVGISASAFAPDGRHLAISASSYGTMLLRLR